jgi:hypothetical protein
LAVLLGLLKRPRKPPQPWPDVEHHAVALVGAVVRLDGGEVVVEAELGDVGSTEQLGTQPITIYSSL